MKKKFEYCKMDLDDCLLAYDQEKKAFINEVEMPLILEIQNRIRARILEICGGWIIDFEEPGHFEKKWAAVTTEFYVRIVGDNPEDEGFYKWFSCEDSGNIIVNQYECDARETEDRTLHTLSEYRELYEGLRLQGFFGDAKFFYPVK